MKKKLIKIVSFKKVSIVVSALLLVSFFVFAKTKNETKIVKNTGMTKNASFMVPKLNAFDCLSAAAIQSFGCKPTGVDQATLTVRSNGTWDFSVHYCCNISPKNCSNSGGGRATGPGSLKHAEWSINNQGCLALTVQQVY